MSQFQCKCPTADRGNFILNHQIHEYDAGGDEHFVQFYENDAFLVEGVTDYIGSALALGDKGIVIATKPHLEALEENLRHRGFLAGDPSSNNDKYLPLEADTLIPKFMVNGMPDEMRFIDVMGGLIREAAAGHSGHIHVFGEMAAILCDEKSKILRSGGKHEAAIRMEKCFNKLIKQYRFSLLCGYPMGVFPRASDAKLFHEVCSLHSSVIPTEKYNASASIGLLQRTIASLQQKAFSLVSEVSERLLIEQALREVNFDRLTGLPNRNVFQDRLQMEIRRAHRAQLSLALLFIDLDYFKEINDTLGHPVGDTLLKHVGQRLSSSVRGNDTVARLGGDEFTVILSQVNDPSTVGHVAQNILQKLLEPFELGSNKIYISASIGITFYPEDAISPQNLIRNADQAMYASKDLGRNRVTYFTKSMQESAQKRMRLTSELRDAMPGNQFRLHYQPIVNLGNGKIQKAEALLRWLHPVNGVVSPADFIPIAERTGMIIDIGEWVFYEAARQVKRWRKYDLDFQVSVNVSPAQFHTSKNNQLDEWSGFLMGNALAQASTSSGITVEITEGLLLDASPAILNQLLTFRDAGIQVALDDFGTGYSSLSYLRKFDIDYLKIDRSFVIGLDIKSDNLALCEAIILMAHKLGLKVNAEGVESHKQCDLLKAAGCDFAQGYLFSKPVPAEEFEIDVLGSNKT